MANDLVLVNLQKCQALLASCRTEEDATKIMAMADAAYVYGKRVGAGIDTVNQCTLFRVKAERRLGEILGKKKATGRLWGRKSKLDNTRKVLSNLIPTLAELKISLKVSARCRKLVKQDEAKIEKLAGKATLAHEEISPSELIRLVLKADRAKEVEAIKTHPILTTEGPFDVLIIDPPWPYGTKYDPNTRRVGNPYPEMSLEQITSMEYATGEFAPVQDKASKDCILFLWTTHKFMRHSFPILDAWGFRDVAIGTWVKDRIGIGSWLRSQTEYYIMAVRGKPKVDLTNQSTVIFAPMRQHSRKPDEFYNMVKELCRGSIGEYFSREKREGITNVLSNELE